MTQETEREDFIRRLGAFRARLSPIEGRALDTILRTAEQAKPVGDVEAHGWFFGGGTADPNVMPDSSDTVAPGQTSSWWDMYSSRNNPFAS